MLAVVVFAAVPKVYVHSLLGHTHEQSVVKDGISFTEDKNTQDCNFEKFDTPVYYTVFKFILNFLPLKEAKPTSFIEKPTRVQQPHFNTSPLRGPPRA